MKDIFSVVKSLFVRKTSSRVAKSRITSKPKLSRSTAASSTFTSLLQYKPSLSSRSASSYPTSAEDDTDEYNSSIVKQKEIQHKIRDEKFIPYFNNQYIVLNDNKTVSVLNTNENGDINRTFAVRDFKSVTNIVMSPDSSYGAFVDSFGRIWIWDCARCQFIRIFKGYRSAQLGWLYVNRTVDMLINGAEVPSPMIDNIGEGQTHSSDKMSSFDVNLSDLQNEHYFDFVRSSNINKNINNKSSDDHHQWSIKQKQKTNKSLLYSLPTCILRRSVLLLVLYVPSRGLLEIHHLGSHKRLYAVNIFTDATLIYHLYVQMPLYAIFCMYCFL